MTRRIERIARGTVGREGGGDHGPFCAINPAAYLGGLFVLQGALLSWFAFATAPRSASGATSAGASGD